MRRKFMQGVAALLVVKPVTACSSNSQDNVFELTNSDTTQNLIANDNIGDTGIEYAGSQGSDFPAEGSNYAASDIGAGVGLSDNGHAAGIGLNVMDYGAIGDGITDDSEAFQQAIDASEDIKKTNRLPQSISFGSQPSLIVPAGKYRLSKALVCGSELSVVGFGSPILNWVNSNRGLVFDRGYKIHIQGLTLQGCSVGVDVKTNNLDTANLHIINCKFINCDVAISIDESPSTHLTVDRCFFFRCVQVLIVSCDKAVISNSWITSSSKLDDQAVILNRRGSLILDSLICVPAVIPQHNQRWIDNYGSLTCTHCRFGSELGGFNVVSNYTKFDSSSPVTPNSIVIHDCEVYSLGNPFRRALLYLEEIPNIISIENNRGLVRVPAILVSENINRQSYFDVLLGNNGFCRFSVKNNVNESSNKLPEFMQNWQPEIHKSIGLLPTEGIWVKGATIINQEVTMDKETPYGWICVETGKPGIWREI